MNRRTFFKTTGGALAALAMAVSVSAGDLRWLPGLDLVLPIETKFGTPGFLGFDRDTGRASVLFVKDQCYTSWVWRPSEGEGAITQILPIGPGLFALYHESGLLRLEVQPDAWICESVEK